MAFDQRPYCASTLQVVKALRLYLHKPQIRVGGMVQLTSHKHNPFLAFHSLHIRSVSRYWCCGGGSDMTRQQTPNFLKECATVELNRCLMSSLVTDTNRGGLLPRPTLPVIAHRLFLWSDGEQCPEWRGFHLPASYPLGPFLSQAFCHSPHSPLLHKQAWSSPRRLQHLWLPRRRVIRPNPSCSNGVMTWFTRITEAMWHHNNVHNL